MEEVKVTPKENSQNKHERERISDFFKYVRYLFLIGGMYPGRVHKNGQGLFTIFSKTYTTVNICLQFGALVLFGFETYSRIVSQTSAARPIGFMLVFTSTLYVSIKHSIVLPTSLDDLETQYAHYQCKYGMDPRFSRLAKYMKKMVLFTIIFAICTAPGMAITTRLIPEVFCEAYPICRLKGAAWYLGYALLSITYSTMSMQWECNLIIFFAFSRMLSQEFKRVLTDMRKIRTDSDIQDIGEETDTSHFVSKGEKTSFVIKQEMVKNSTQLNDRDDERSSKGQRNTRCIGNLDRLQSENNQRKYKPMDDTNTSRSHRQQKGNISKNFGVIKDHSNIITVKESIGSFLISENEDHPQYQRNGSSTDLNQSPKESIGSFLISDDKCHPQYQKNCSSTNSNQSPLEAKLGNTEDILKTCLKHHDAIMTIMTKSSDIGQHSSFVMILMYLPLVCSFIYGGDSTAIEIAFLAAGLSWSLCLVGGRLIFEALVSTNVNMFITRLTCESVGYNVYGLINVNMPTLLGIFGTLVTYIIVVVQFRSSPPCTLPDTNITLCRMPL